MIIIRPILTEKSLREASLGEYTFEVDKKANKNQITKAIEKMFSVHVTKISTMIVKGQMKRKGKKRLLIKTADIKKAKLKLKENEKITLFDVG